MLSVWRFCINSKVNLLNVPSSHSNFQTSTNARLIHARTGPRVLILLDVTAVIAHLDLLALIAKVTAI